MSQKHSSRFLTLVEEARQRVPELSVEQVKQKLSLGFEDLGPQEVKNINLF